LNDLEVSRGGENVGCASVIDESEITFDVSVMNPFSFGRRCRRDDKAADDSAEHERKSSDHIMILQLRERIIYKSAVSPQCLN
jgi:hypothetical protein